MFILQIREMQFKSKLAGEKISLNATFNYEGIFKIKKTSVTPAPRDILQL